ncbi:uncharacterized protein LOC135842467 isoform X2 [Planococcus citri]|uniref:uncharacterized protein LOC135842467 isoform X2 n=1 Tax=Planococcus citri TaxID=170843 RepID=UPI0031F88A1A
MVKMSETIICQRFIQNAWKKDLCSNCFKSKEDHAVPEKKITYRWTSHVDNFPQHSILRRSEKCAEEKRKCQSVSFHADETEIIGFGGEECSSDDEFYPSYNDEPVIETDNEEEDKEFRKLTQTNTDFNSVPANLRNNGPANKTTSSPPKTYSYLKLGAPQTDADGRRQTLQVSVEPFKNSVTVNGSCSSSNGDAASGTLSNNDCSKVHLNKILLEASSNGKSDEEKTEPIETAKRNGDCDLKNDVVLSKQSVVCDINANSINNDKCTVNNVTNVNVNETINEQNIYTKMTTTTAAAAAVATKEQNGDCAEKYIRINVPKPPEQQIESKLFDEISPKDVAENMKNAKCKLEPLFKLNAYENTSPTKRLSIYQSTIQEDRTDGGEEKKKLSFKESNPIAGLPLITSKDLEIEIDRPGSREMVGEPDGKADSDDSGDPPVSVEYLEESKPSSPDSDSVYANPQRSFLHGFAKDKPIPASKPACLQNGVKKDLVAPATPIVVSKEIRECAVSVCGSVPSTPKMHAANSCNGTGSTKRQAPKPPSPKITPQTPILCAQRPFSQIITPISSVISFSEKKCDAPSTNEVPSVGIKRRLNLDSHLLNRNSLNLNVILGQNGTYKSNTLSNGSTSPVASINGDCQPIENGLVENGTPRSPSKCTRSLSCDSIVSSPSISLSEKTRKYSGATIKVKSTIRKFLRFNNKDDEKSENETPAVSVPRRRIEIIHPLDLNKSSIEILPPAGAAEDTQKTDHENEPAKTVVVTPTSPSCPPIPGRPTKPPPPPRTQSLDQKIASEISRPVRPPPPKSLNLKAAPPPRFECLSKTSNNVYENLGESRQSVAPAKPQRASSIRDRARQQTTTTRDENLVISVSERESVPECDRTAQSDSSETPPSSSIPYCGSETESEMYHSVSSSTTESTHSELSDAVSETEPRKGKSIVHSCLEDNYDAVVIANHETLSHLLEQLNQTTLVPNALKVLQTTLHIRFEHLVVVESSRIAVADWYFYNAKWNGHDVVVSLSTKPFGLMKSLPSSITLFPLVKFTDLIPSRYVKNDTSVEDINAYITVWNEQKIESLSSYCKKPENLSVSEAGLLLSQLTDAFNHLLACGIEDISLNEIFVCKRNSDLESKLLLLPISVDYLTNTDKTSMRRISLCKCILEVANMLLAKQQISQVITRVLEDEKAVSLSQAKTVVQYWLWGPCDVTLNNDRQSALQRWLDLERATFLHKIVCKKYNQFNLSEKSHLMFLVRTNAKLLTEASYLLEKS